MPSNPSQDLILITCASGKIATHLIPLLLPTYPHLRLTVHTESSASHLRSEFPSAQVLTADLHDKTECEKVLSGVTSIIYIGPSFHPYEVKIGTNMIRAAESESEKPNSVFKHFIYSSCMHYQVEDYDRDFKQILEQNLVDWSSLDYTILQPTHFMELFPIRMLALSTEEKPVFRAMWNFSSPSSFIALDDYAKAVKRVLDEREKHFFATYQLVSTRTPDSFGEICELATEMLGKDVQMEVLKTDEAKKMFAKNLYQDGVKESISRGLFEELDDNLSGLLWLYETHSLVGSANVLEWLIGEKTMQWEEMFAMEMEKVRE